MSDFEIMQNMMEATFNLAYHPYFKALKFKVSALNNFLEEVINSDEEYDIQRFYTEGMRRSLTPLLFQLMVEKISMFIKTHKDNKNEVLPAIWIVEFLKRGLQVWDIPFFFAIFTRQVIEHPLSTNKKIWELIKDFVPRKIEEPEEPIIVKGEEEEEEKAPPGYKKDEKTGLLLPDDNTEDRDKKIIIPD